MGADIDVESVDALLMRAIQKWDGSPAIGAATDQLLGPRRELERQIATRRAAFVVLDLLGSKFGLECTGDNEGDGNYSHDGDTCPIHEWLVPADSPDYEAE